MIHISHFVKIIWLNNEGKGGRNGRVSKCRKYGRFKKSKHNNNSKDKHTEYTALAIKSSTFQDIHGIQSLKEHT